ncbi:MAG TPA: ATP-binding protein, partial [Acidimicrobiales bacterium]
MGWDLGLFWALDDRAEALVCRQAWHRPEMPVIEFERGSWSRTFATGRGLPGRVWASGRPAWILDIARDTNFPRRVPAVGCGLHSAFACPVGVGDRTLGVIEFFSRRTQEPDAGLLEMMGTVAGTVGQFIERKAVEDELRRREQELADFFDNATVGLHWVGPDGIVLRANQAELDMLGYGREEYVGRPIADFHADQDVIRDILRRLNSGEKLVEYPARLRCKDGTVKDVLIDSSVLWRDGQFVHTRCFTRDVTERKRAAAEVRDQEQRTRTILESITDAFFALGRDWRFTYVNRQAEALLGRRRDDLLGKRLWEEFAPAQGTEFERGYRRAMDEGVTVTFEEFYAPHERWYEVHAYPSPDGLAVYFRDATGRRRHEEERERLLAEAQEANRAKTQFLAVLSHELRTPLNPILLASSAMLERPGDPEELRPTLEMIRQNVLLQARLIDDLLDVMRIVRGKMPLHWEVADGHTIVGRAVEVCRGEVLGRRLDLTLEMAAANRHVNADPARLQQVFWNLIKNAVKFTPEGGSIRVRTRNDSIGGEGRLVVEVSDTGIGIEPDVLPRIFDPFQQGETTITRKFGGLGLGLAICKGIVEAHGGLLDAESGGRGRGTTFRVALKALPEPAAEGDGEPAGRTPAASGDVPPSSLRILVVEDEPATLRLMARLLRGLGHEAETAGTIAQAIEVFEAGEFDLVVSDIGLPDGNGLDLMRRAVAHRGPVAAIALTGYGMEEDIRRSQEAGFTAHLTKPIDFAKLEAMI